MPTLEVILGLLLIFLFYSLLATTVMELIAGWLSLRGNHLRKTLKNMLSSEDESVFQAFVDNPLFEQLAGRFFGKKSPPSYLDAGSFSSILMKVIGRIDHGNSLPEKIGAIPDRKLKEVLEQLLEDADYDFGAFQEKVMDWYDNVMDRASGWYKKAAQRYLLLLGLGIAIFFNADTLSVYSQLTSGSPESQAQLEALVGLAGQVAGQGETLPEQERAALYKLLDGSLRTVNGAGESDPLGIGWSNFELNAMTPLDWLWKIGGWLITALAISLGAPFWFDLLKKVINIRSAGKVPPALIPTKHTSLKIGGERATVDVEEPVG